jgi:hypothetical protein
MRLGGRERKSIELLKKKWQKVASFVHFTDFCFINPSFSLLLAFFSIFN